MINNKYKGLKGVVSEPVICIKSSKTKGGTSLIPVKCPECCRVTMKDDKCERCGYVDRKNRVMLI